MYQNSGAGTKIVRITARREQRISFSKSNTAIMKQFFFAAKPADIVSARTEGRHSSTLTHLKRKCSGFWHYFLRRVAFAELREPQVMTRMQYAVGLSWLEVTAKRLQITI
jgi:hypothetical protein